MTTTLTKDPRFGAITRVFGPSPLWAVCGALHKVLVATVSGGQVVFSGESADLGAEVLAVNTETSPNCHVLTANGLTFVTNTSTPQIVSQVLFNPGGGTWLHMFGGVFLATPLAKGGIQVVHGTTGAIIASHLSGMQSSQFAAADSSTDRLWVVDQLNASLSTFTVSSTTGAITFMGKIRAPNCRDVVKVVVDIDEESLFVVCRNRILRFDIPTTSDTPVFAQDYGAAAVPYVDFVVLEADKYWISQATSLLPSPLDLYYGPMLGVWETSTEELIVAAPQSSLWTVNNVVPYYDAETLVNTAPAPAPSPASPPPVPLPPVIAPLPPVITSSLTASVVEDTLFSYTITATGTGPIYYDVVSPPSWLTGINHITGVITGTPADPATVNITITATGAGGTDAETLVVTVASAVGEVLGLGILNGAIQVYSKDGFLIYVAGTFTSVKDRNGTYTRNRIGCFSLTTGLWTSWNPGASTAAAQLYAHTDGFVYLTFPGPITVGGVALDTIGRVSKATGLTDSGFTPAVAGVSGGWARSFASSGGELLVIGNMTSIGGVTVNGVAAISPGGAITSRSPTVTGGTIGTLAPAGLAVAPGGGYFLADVGVMQNPGFPTTGYRAREWLKLGVGSNEVIQTPEYHTNSAFPNDTISPPGSWSPAYDTSGRLVVFNSGGDSTWNVWTTAQPTVNTGKVITRIFRLSSSGVHTPAVSPALTSGNLKAIACRSDGTLLMGGSFSAGLSAYDPDTGVHDSTFEAAVASKWSTTWGVEQALIVDSSLLLVLGAYSAASTYEGSAAHGIMVIDATTGNRHS